MEQLFDKPFQYSLHFDMSVEVFAGNIIQFDCWNMKRYFSLALDKAVGRNFAFLDQYNSVEPSAVGCAEVAEDIVDRCSPYFYWAYFMVLQNNHFDTNKLTRLININFRNR